MDAHTHIYVLGLREGKYYIGKSKNPESRIKKHREGNGAKWTQMYPVERVLETIPGDEFAEDATVKKYMSKYGIENVRGGTYVCAVLTQEEVQLLQRELRMSADVCVRCGRKGHFVANCYARKDAAGRPIADVPAPVLSTDVPTEQLALPTVPVESAITSPPTEPNALAQELSALVTSVENIAVGLMASYNKWFN